MDREHSPARQEARMADSPEGDAPLALVEREMLAREQVELAWAAEAAQMVSMVKAAPEVGP